MKLTRAQIEQISQKFKKMPPAPPTAVNTTKQEAVKLLANDIASLQRRGYTLEQITESLKNEGLDLKTPTLKCHLLRARAATELSLGDRMELERWRDECKTMLSEVVGG